MSTLIEYSNSLNTSEAPLLRPKLTTIGYLIMPPEQALRKLLPEFYVVDYLGTKIPSKSKYDNENNGLKISSLEDGIGLTGNLKMFNKGDLFNNPKRDLFNNCKHKPFKKRQKKDIVEQMKNNIIPTFRGQEPLSILEAKKYWLIFDMLGFPMSSENIIKFSTHRDYFKPSHNCAMVKAPSIAHFPRKDIF